MASCDLAVFGGRGGGALAAWVWSRLAPPDQRCTAGLLNDEAPAGTSIDGVPVLGPFGSWAALPATTRFLAPLHKAKQMGPRAQLINALGIEPHRWATLVDPSALVAPGVTMGIGTFVAPFARVTNGARLGNHVAVRSGAQVSHDCTVGDFGFVGTNAALLGYCTAAEGAHVAPGAIVGDEVRLGRYCVVGIGAVVLTDVADGAVVAGNPARVIGEVAVP